MRREETSVASTVHIDCKWRLKETQDSIVAECALATRCSTFTLLLSPHMRRTFGLQRATTSRTSDRHIHDSMSNLGAPLQ